MMANLLTPLQSMNTATIEMQLGADPQVRVGLLFKDQAQAANFKRSLDGFVTMIAGFMAAGAAPEEQKDAKAMQLALSKFFLTQDNELLFTTLDKGLLEELNKLGIPWADGIGADEGAEEQLDDEPMPVEPDGGIGDGMGQ